LLIAMGADREVVPPLDTLMPNYNSATG
jgi:hypothetical protein